MNKQRYLLILLFNFAGFAFAIEHGHTGLQGRRPTMEDAHVAIKTGDHGFYGVFDGHGGSEVANYVAKFLYHNILTNSGFKINPMRALIAGCLVTDQDLPSFAYHQGSTAIMALIKNKCLYVGNIGDSRAVLSHQGQAVALSSDHKPTRADELKRITDAGGFVTQRGGVARVQGVLAMARAFGDLALRPYVICEPETCLHRITTGDEFLILACDGVWDVLSNQQAVELVRASLQQNGDCKLASKILVDAAYQAGSMDNISALIIKF
jgi:protein phosphatase 1L